MTILMLGIALFFLPHLVPFSPGVRAALAGRVGEGRYTAVFSLVSAAGLALIVCGYWMGEGDPSADAIVYRPPDWARHVTMLLVLLAFISLAIFLHKGRLKILLRNPMSIAVALWAAGHLLANGQLSSVLLFGAFLIYGLADILVNTVRGNVPAIVAKPRHDPIAVLAGLLLFVLFFFLFHPYVLNRPLV